MAPSTVPDEPTRSRVPAEPPARSTGFHLLAAGLAWAFPGLGHLVLGRVRRGLVLAVTITSLYLAGLLIGGVAVIDRRDHPAWFVSQALVAPSFLLDRHHARVRDAAVRAVGRNDAERRRSGYAPAFGRAQEQGTLYTAAAGLLNLLAILDAVSRRPGHERRRGGRREEERATEHESAAPAVPA